MFAYTKMLVLCLLIVSFLHFPYGEETEDSPIVKTKPEFPLKLIVLKEVPVSSVLAGVLEDVVFRKGK